MSRIDEIRARLARITVADLDLHATGDLAYLLDRVAELEGLAISLRNGHDNSLQAMGWQRMPDWACRQCRPNSEMLVDGFVCALHEADAIAARLQADAARGTP